MNQSRFLNTCGAVMALALMLSGVASAQTKPNILVVMVDDMGFSDLGCYGSEIATPNIDRLAAAGVRFSQFYTNAKCDPTRATLMTGCYPSYKGTGYQPIHIIGAMKQAGYWTARVGKVHDPLGTPDRSATMGPGASHWDLSNPKNPSMAGFKLDGKSQPNFLQDHPDFYSSDAWTDYTIKFIQEGKATGKPFFIYTAFNAPHFPLHARAEDIAKYRGKYREGWAKLRETRYAKQKQIGLFGGKLPVLSPQDDAVADWNSLSDAEKKLWDEKMAVYAAMIDRVDQGIGRILAALKQAGVYDNTVIFFLSDNGACSQDDRNATEQPGVKGSWTYQGIHWANASNTPFRKYKVWNHEGGIADPLIVWGKGVQPGNDHALAWVGDIPATCLDLAGAPNNQIQGKPLTPGFTGGPRPLHEHLEWAILRGNAARQGDWKIVRRERGPWELYNLAEDRTELHNVAAKHPELVAELSANWEKFNKETNWIGKDSNAGLTKPKKEQQ